MQSSILTEDRPGPVVPGLGTRLRAARQACGLSQAALVAGHFTKSYVSAVESGRAHPSLRALELMARRLGVPVSELLTAPAAPAEARRADGTALEGALAEATGLLRAQQAAEALHHLHQAATTYAPLLPDVDPAFHYRIPLLRGQAYLALADLAAAREDLTTALRLAGEQGDAEAAAAARDLLGETLRRQGQLIPAQQQHAQNYQAIRDGQIQDPALRLRIYNHLLAGCRARGEDARAQEIFAQAQDLLDSIATPEAQMHTYGELSQVGGGLNPDRAEHYAGQAQALGTTVTYRRDAVALCLDLAAVHIEGRRYPAAVRLLERAAALLPPAGQDGPRSRITAGWAALELGRDRPDRAGDWAKTSVRLGARAWEALPSTADLANREATRELYARALWIAAQVAEARGQVAAAADGLAQACALLAPTPSALGAVVEGAYADLLAARGQHQAAAEHYRAALAHQVPASRS